MFSSGLVFNIQKFSIHDGPGIRTIVFLKGCPLQCQWCSNPEGIDRHPTLAVNAEKCITTKQCQRCLEICPKNVINVDSANKVEIDREKCDLCGECVKVCPTKALNIFGTLMSVEEVMNIVEQDDLFYSSSGGGLTLGGGEPLSNPVFARDLLREAQLYGFETAIETSGHASWPDFEEVIHYADVVLYDIKCMSAKKHKAYTKIDNRVILTNLEKACLKFSNTSIYVRTPIIPGFNNTEDDIKQIVSFLKKLPKKVDYELLPYHQYGENKYSMIGKNNQKPTFQKYDTQNFETLKKIVETGEM